MSYSPPNVFVHQVLRTPGGVLNATPDLPVCYVGPAYNVINYIAGNTASLALTSARSTVSTVATGISNSLTLQVEDTVGFYRGDLVTIAGGSATSTPLQARVDSVDSTNKIITLDRPILSNVDAQVLAKAATLSNPNAPSTYSLPSQTSGQQVEDTSTVKVYTAGARVDTFQATGYITQDSSDPWGLGVGNIDPAYVDKISINAVLPQASIDAVPLVDPLTVGSDFLIADADATLLSIGDRIRIYDSADATNSAIATIVGLSPGVSAGTVGITVDVATQFSLVGAPASLKIHHHTYSNYNYVTNAPRFSAGDELVFSYTAVSGATALFSTTIREITQNSVGVVTYLQTVDLIPSNLWIRGGVTDVFAISTPTTIPLDTSTISGLKVGDYLVIKDGEAATVDLHVRIVQVNTTDIEVSLPILNAALDGVILEFKVKTEVSISCIRTVPSVQVPVAYTVVDTINNSVTLSPRIMCDLGYIISGNIHIQYKAFRPDLANRLLTFFNVDEARAVLGDMSDENPAGLACLLGFLNTTGSINLITVPSNDLLGYSNALELSETLRLYLMIPLTNDKATLTTFKQHVEAMSVPGENSWRITMYGYEVPKQIPVGDYDEYLPATLTTTVDSSGPVPIIVNEPLEGLEEVSGGPFAINGVTFTSPTATFVADKVTPSDIIYFKDANTGAIKSAVVRVVVNNTKILLESSEVFTVSEYYVYRNLSKPAQATHMAAEAAQIKSNRVFFTIQKPGVTINGTRKYLPSYYLSAAIAAIVSSVPVQMNITNMSIAGIDDILLSNFYFSKASLKELAGAGSMVVVQDTLDGVPYVRHSISTDTTVLEYRELLKVKNWDFLSYYYGDKIKDFIGKWNITKETLNVIRRTLDASTAFLKDQSLPRIGPPLIDAVIEVLEQDSVNKDRIKIHLGISMVDPNNYEDLYLIV